MDWPRPILTDSGGVPGDVAVGLCARSAKRGSGFQSHIDGRAEFLSPERAPCRSSGSWEATSRMVFDECLGIAGNPCRDREIHGALHALGESNARRRRSPSSRTKRKRDAPASASCRAATFADLRRRSAEALMDIGFDGYAPWAAWRWANRRPPCSKPWKLPCRISAPWRSGRAICRWAAEAEAVSTEHRGRTVLRGIDMFGSTFCPPVLGAMAEAFTWEGAAKTSRMPVLPMIRRKAVLDARCHCHRPAASSPAPICIMRSWPGRLSPPCCSPGTT